MNRHEYNNNSLLYTIALQTRTKPSQISTKIPSSLIFDKWHKLTIKTTM